MDNNGIEVRFLESVRKKNTTKHTSKKFFVAFFFVFLIAMILGSAFCKVSGSSVSESMKSQMADHFANVFRGCETPTDYFTVIITCASSDFRYLLIIFTAGFTYFCKYATGTMIGVRAFTLGFCSEFLHSSIKSGILALSFPYLSFLTFVACELLILALIIYLSVKATLFGDDFRRLRGRRSLILRSPVIYRYIFLFLTAIGLIIIINAAYCWLSSLL